MTPRGVTAAKKPKLLDHLPAPPVFLLDSNDCCMLSGLLLQRLLKMLHRIDAIDLEAIEDKYVQSKGPVVNHHAWHKLHGGWLHGPLDLRRNFWLGRTLQVKVLAETIYWEDWSPNNFLWLRPPRCLWWVHPAAACATWVCQEQLGTTCSAYLASAPLW